MKGYHESIYIFPQDMLINVVFNEYHNRKGNYDAHWHERVEILMITEGAMQVICDGQIINAKAGELVFINPNQLHSTMISDSGASYYCITIDMNFLISNNIDLCDKNMLLLQNGEVQITNHIQDPEIYDLLLKMIEQKNEKKNYYESMMRGYVTLCMGKLLQNHHLQTREPVLDNLIAEIIAYIAAHYQENLSSKRLAEHFGFSLSYFCRYFKKETGVTLIDYINSVRLNKACILLQGDDQSIAEVSASVGYTSINYFNSKFKEVMGITPLQFRRESETKKNEIMTKLYSKKSRS